VLRARVRLPRHGRLPDLGAQLIHARLPSRDRRARLPRVLLVAAQAVAVAASRARIHVAAGRIAAGGACDAACGRAGPSTLLRRVVCGDVQLCAAVVDAIMATAARHLQVRGAHRSRARRPPPRTPAAAGCSPCAPRAAPSWRARSPWPAPAARPRGASGPARPRAPRVSGAAAGGQSPAHDTEAASLVKMPREMPCGHAPVPGQVGRPSHLCFDSAACHKLPRACRIKSSCSCKA